MILQGTLVPVLFLLGVGLAYRLLIRHDLNCCCFFDTVGGDGVLKPVRQFSELLRCGGCGHGGGDKSERGTLGGNAIALADFVRDFVVTCD